MFSRLKGARPSPALVISLVALFVSLGGVGYAAATIGSAQIKNNSIRGKDIRNSTITGKDVKNSGLTGSDIKNSSLGGSDVKNNNLTGSDILESSLGTVPNALNATTAANAGNAASVGGFRIARVTPFTLTNNQTREVLREGPFTFTATCAINVGGTTDTATIDIATTQNNAAFDSDDTTPDLDTNTPLIDRQFVESSGNTGLPNFDQETDGSAIATDGTEIDGSELYAGVNILNQPGVCRFGGFFTIG
jgi:hypothetical protein